MIRQKISTSMSRGRGTDPFPGTPSPKATPSRLHKIFDTPESLGQVTRSLSTSRLCEINLPAICKDAYASQTGYPAYA
jgi:hypothetical protein